MRCSENVLILVRVTAQDKKYPRTADPTLCVRREAPCEGMWAHIRNRKKPNNRGGVFSRLAAVHQAWEPEREW